MLARPTSFVSMFQKPRKSKEPKNAPKRYIVKTSFKTRISPELICARTPLRVLKRSGSLFLVDSPCLESMHWFGESELKNLVEDDSYVDLIVITPDGKENKLEVQTDQTVGALKKILIKELQLTLDFFSMDLVLAKKILMEHKSLSYYMDHLKPGAILKIKSKEKEINNPYMFKRGSQKYRESLKSYYGRVTSF